MMGQDKKITPNPFKVHAYYRDGQGDEATFKTWWVVEYSKDSGKTWTKLAFNVQTSGITINPDNYSLGADGMIRATIYTDSGRTKISRPGRLLWTLACLRRSRLLRYCPMTENLKVSTI